jgi:hypothetical protein
LILRALKEQYESKDDMSLSKFLSAFKLTLQRVIARIGNQVQTVSLKELEEIGTETYQSQLQVLFSIIQS